MPHDCKGVELKVGDTVFVPCKVLSVQTGTEYCNLTVETIEPMFPGKDKTCVTLNTKQVEKCGSVCLEHEEMTDPGKATI